MRSFACCAMPARGSRRDACLVDTSVAVALVLGDHPDHDVVFDALSARDLGLSGHAAFETFSVLTRLPAPARRTPASASRIMAENFPQTRFLGSQRASQLLAELAVVGIAGGAVYDALVGATAVEHQMLLVSRDRRATEVYRALGVDVELLD